jgi:hypothetical protein
MSIWAEPDAAGIAIANTPSINAKLATFTLRPLIFLFSVELIPVCRINYREQ